MKMNYVIINIVLFSFILSAADDSIQMVNDKFAYVNDIYSESWALIIGINDYENVEPLTYAVQDAISVKEMFIEQYGFKENNIILIIDEKATKDNIEKAFSDILTKASDKDRVVVFYAGHGETFKLPNGGDMGYLIPVDGNLDNLYLSSIPMKSIYDIADMSYAKHILYLIDACYGGLAMNTRGLSKNLTPEYLKKMTKERGRQVITAGGKDEQVQERPEWGHSAFTKNLLKGLGDYLADENLDGVITADELGSFIKNRVVVDVDGAHTPQKGRIGSDMGEFVFISEKLGQQLANSSPNNEKLNDLESKMAELEKLLELQKNQRGLSSDKIETSPINNVPTSKQKLATAAKLSWVFPGIGHYYSGHVFKGLFFSGIEIASLAIVFNSEYSTLDKEYNNNLNLMDSAINQEDYSNYKQEVDRLLDKKNKVQITRVIAGMTSIGFWIWNTKDIKKIKQSYYSNKVSFGFNPSAQIEMRIKL